MHSPKTVSIITGLFLFGICGLTLVVGLQLVLAARSLPDEKQIAVQLQEHVLPLASEVFDRRGLKIGEFSWERRYRVSLDQLPKHVVDAFLSAEDGDFYEHTGISVSAIFRAALANLRSLRIKQGASTITQQVARLYFLNNEKTWTRKVKEAVLALEIERQLTKDQILELYLNKIYLGGGSYGVEAAARNYFRKSATELNVGEAAVLAGLPKAPSYYAPHRFPERATKRQSVVLARMVEDGRLSQADAAIWMAKPVTVAGRPEAFHEAAPYFVQEVRREVIEKLELASLPRSGLRIYTTLSSQVQDAARTSLVASLEDARRKMSPAPPTSSKDPANENEIEGAVVVVDPVTGAVLAMQGGGRFEDSQYNRAERTRRRVAGLFMPIYLSLAFEHGYRPHDSVAHQPISGRPKETGAFPTLYEALVEGRVFEASRLYVALGAGSVKEHAKRFGLEFDRSDLLLALGYGRATPLQIAAAYSAFFNKGRRTEPYLIERIESARGRLIYKRKRAVGRRVISNEVAFIVHHLMNHGARYGATSLAGRAHSATAAVVGVTDDLHNSWFAGGWPRMLAVAWIGSERGRQRVAANEGQARLLGQRLWKSFVEALPRNIVDRVRPVKPPPGISFSRLRLNTAKGVVQRTVPVMTSRQAVRGTKNL